ncbi:MAG: hypothetical protein ACJ8FU_08690 [Xanthobacteraceae bacterium]
MSEMVERVARAIYGAYRGASDWEEDNYRMDESVRQEWREVARAAIEAMGEPIAGICAALAVAIASGVSDEQKIRDVIVAALKEPDRPG